jgi:hypothetical protein
MADANSTLAVDPQQSSALPLFKPDLMGQIGRALFFPGTSLVKLKPHGELRHYRELFVMALAQLHEAQANYRALSLRHTSTVAAWRAEREAHAATKSALARATAVRS